MITAINTVHEHEGKQYHLQAEDLGEAQAAFEARVYLEGSVLWKKPVSYKDLADQGLSRADLEDAVHALMRKTLTTVQAAIAKGKLG